VTVTRGPGANLTGLAPPPTVTVAAAAVTYRRSPSHLQDPFGLGLRQSLRSGAGREARHGVGYLGTCDKRSRI